MLHARDYRIYHALEGPIMRKEKYVPNQPIGTMEVGKINILE